MTSERELLWRLRSGAGRGGRGCREGRNHGGRTTGGRSDDIGGVEMQEDGVGGVEMQEDGVGDAGVDGVQKWKVLKRKEKESSRE
ncbi:hypothetical protein C1H46_029654 [Malus baccata]|uniref:Uncharacterized protein n=1 Tax=Malus baccata TaxID=106549 RepID=A0A540LEA7_MALBA|nr:hypothetical protein C1H46_029654 [Malus baccata]